MIFKPLNQPRGASELPRWLQITFQDLGDLLSQVDAVDGGVTAITGALVVPTKLTKVTKVMVSLAVAPVAGACFVQAVPAGRSVGLTVYSNAFAVSVIASSVNWLAFGIP